MNGRTPLASRDDGAVNAVEFEPSTGGKAAEERAVEALGFDEATGGGNMLGNPVPTVVIRLILRDSPPETTWGRCMNDGSYYSIPRPGSTNTHARWFTLKVTKPAGSTVKKVTATLLGPGELMTVVDDPPGSNVQVLDAETVKVRVTMHDRPSTVASTPPPTHLIKYRFKLTVDNGGNELTHEEESETLHALWRMPDGFGRFGYRDDNVGGGDDWVSRGTYNWMEANRSLLREINDVSGEHGINLGHGNYHVLGAEIDMWHFYLVPGEPCVGVEDYCELRSAAVLAIRTNDPDAGIREQAIVAREHVSRWVSLSRAGIDGLAALNTVARVLYTFGRHGGDGLPAGWGHSLLPTGATTVGTTVLNLSLGNWSNAKYVPDRNLDHEDHLHITLNLAALGD
jgi:hypothetical protein